MNIPESGSAANKIEVSIVGGDATVRHARQLTLQSENYDVRSYATCSALLSNPRSRDFACIVLDVETNEGALALLREMRATGWRGRAILLDGDNPNDFYVREVEKYGGRVLKRGVGDSSLLAAISESVYRGWSGWNAEG